MKYTEISFSPTGGTSRVAGIIGQEMVNGFAAKMAAAFAQRKENELFI